MRTIEISTVFEAGPATWFAVAVPSWAEYAPLLNDERLRFTDGSAGLIHVSNSTPHARPLLTLHPESGARMPVAGDVLELVEAA